MYYIINVWQQVACISHTKPFTLETLLYFQCACVWVYVVCGIVSWQSDIHWISFDCIVWCGIKTTFAANNKQNTIQEFVKHKR